VVAADVEAQEVATLVEVDHAGLFLVEGQPPGQQPRGQPRLDLLGLLPGVAQGEHIVGVPDQDRGIRHRFPGIFAGGAIANSSGLFHAMQGHIHQRGTDHTALGCSLFGRGEPTLFDDTGLQPPGDHFPGWEGAEHL
jgi:hypothetical protein